MKPEGEEKKVEDRILDIAIVECTCFLNLMQSSWISYQGLKERGRCTNLGRQRGVRLIEQGPSGRLETLPQACEEKRHKRKIELAPARKTIESESESRPGKR